MNVSDVDVSIDGRRVVYVASPPDGDGQLWLTRLDRRSNRPVRIPAAGEWGCPRWTADGTHVVAQSATGTGLATIEVRTGRSEPVTLPFNGRHVSCADPSPTDGRLAVAVASGPYEFRQIWIVDPRSKTARQLVSLPPMSIANFPSWSPDGRTIATDVISPDVERNGIWTISPSGAMKQVAGVNRPGATSALQYWAPTWTPAGYQLIYWRFEQNSGSALRILDLQLGRERALTRPFATYPSAAPTVD